MHKYLKLGIVLRFVPEMEKRKVSEVARSSRGFLTAYRKAGGNHRNLTPTWQAEREGFIERHMAQLMVGDESLYDKSGRPSRRHLALVAWAYSPNPAKIASMAQPRSRRG